MITSSSARLNGEITSTGGENPTVRIYSGNSNGGTNPGSWANYVEGVVGLGLFYTDIINFDQEHLTITDAMHLTLEGASWASSTASFSTTPIIVKPTVTNDGGASLITSTSARLNAEITSTGGENPDLHIFWGTSDGDINPGAWEQEVEMGIVGLGTYHHDISGLTLGILTIDAMQKIQLLVQVGLATLQRLQR